MIPRFGFEWSLFKRRRGTHAGEEGERESPHEPLLSGIVGGTDVPVACCCARCSSIEFSASSKLLVLLDRDPAILLCARREQLVPSSHQATQSAPAYALLISTCFAAYLLPREAGRSLSDSRRHSLNQDSRGNHMRFRLWLPAEAQRSTPYDRNSHCYDVSRRQKRRGIRTPTGTPEREL